MFIILLIMKPLHCSHSSELQLIDFHFVFSVKSYLINAETCREQLISSRQFLFKWVAQMCFAWGFLERKKGFCRKSLQILNGRPRVPTCWVQVFSLLGKCWLAAVEDKCYFLCACVPVLVYRGLCAKLLYYWVCNPECAMHSVGSKRLLLMDLAQILL